MHVLLHTLTPKIHFAATLFIQQYNISCIINSLNAQRLWICQWYKVTKLLSNPLFELIFSSAFFPTYFFRCFFALFLTTNIWFLYIILISTQNIWHFTLFCNTLRCKPKTCGTSHFSLLFFFKLEMSFFWLIWVLQFDFEPAYILWIENSIFTLNCHHFKR